MTYSGPFSSPASDFLCSWLLPVVFGIFVCMALFFFGMLIVKVFLDAFGKDGSLNRPSLEWRNSEAIDELKRRVYALEAQLDDIGASNGRWTTMEKR